MSSKLLLVSLAALQGASAWGTLGHHTIAYIAQNFVQNTTEAWAKSILKNDSSTYLVDVATWADSYRYTAEGTFSAPFHYIDAEDNPPKSCNVNFQRDCGEEGCVVSAIANYTRRVQQPKLGDTEVNYALRFLVHFLGDITQPLHDEAFELGGNKVNVTFDGDDTNLHAVWDTSIPEELVGGYSLEDAADWAANLTHEIRKGSFAASRKSWVTGLDIGHAKNSAMIWARDANKYVCSVVLPDGVQPLEDNDLYPTYYNGAVDTVELQIAKAGYRLAKWLDALAAKADVVTHVAPRAPSDGKDLLPKKRAVKSLAKLRREAVGWGCDHQH